MSKFYSINKIKNKKATYNMIFGERSNGKTYALLTESIKNYVETGKQVAYIRRWKEDVIGRRASAIYAGLNEDGSITKLTGGKYSDVYYINGRFYLCNYEDSKPVYNDDDCLGFLFSLSETEHNKSASYPNVTLVIFDEFLTKQLYLQDEFVLFMNTISTIVRRRTDVKIYMLGNTVNKYCPYFSEMGLNHVKGMKQGTIDVYSYGESGLTVAVEYCASMETNKKNNFYFAFNNPKLEMITGGAWELNIYPHLPTKYKPKDVQFTYFIMFNDLIYQCEVVTVGDEFFTYIHNKTTPIKNPDSDLIYTFDYIPKLNYNRNVMKPQNELQKRLLWFFQTGRVFYQDNECGDSIHNYLNVCGRS